MFLSPLEKIDFLKKKIMRIIAIVSQKGGVGKTTTTLNLGAALSEMNRRVLMVDMDPQAHLTMSSGIEPERIRFSIYHSLIIERVPVKKIIKEVSRGLFLVPSQSVLSKLEFRKSEGVEFYLKRAFKGFGKLYNYILIDCPPSMGILTVNALVFAREVFIVVQTEYMALKTLPLLLNSIDNIKRNFNPELEISGFIASLYDCRRKVDKKVTEELRTSQGDKLFKTIIRRNVALAESFTLGKDIFKYKPKSYGARDYFSLAEEVIEMEDRKRK